MSQTHSSMGDQRGAKELLEVWEKCMPLTKNERALALAVFACDGTPDALAQQSIGQRDGALLQLREQLFGRHLHCLVGCPACGEQLELDIDLEQIRTTGGTHPALLEIESAGYLVRFRLPNTLDLAALAPGDHELQLLERCIVAVKQGGVALDAASLPPEAVAAVSAQMAYADPQANVQLALVCPACGHDWSVFFDIVGFLWIEIDAWAKRLLGDVHTLATAYGWHEADILALTPWRRQHYLQLVAG